MYILSGPLSYEQSIRKQTMKRIFPLIVFFILATVAPVPAVQLVRELWEGITNTASNLKGLGSGTTSLGFPASVWNVNPSTSTVFQVDPTTDIYDWMIDVYPLLPPAMNSAGVLSLAPGNTNGWDSSSWAVRLLATGSRISFSSNSTNYFSARIIKRGLWYSGYGLDDSAVGIGFASGSTTTAHFVGAGFTRAVAANGGGGYLTSDGSTDIGDTVYITTGTLGQAGYANHPGDSGGPYYVRAYGPLQEVEGYIFGSPYVNGGLLVGRIITSASGNAQMDVRTYVSTDAIDVDPSTVVWDVSYSFTETVLMNNLLVWMHGTNTPVMIDGIRVATTWAEAIGAEIIGPPTVSPTNVVYAGTPLTLSTFANIDPEDGWFQWLKNGTNVPGSDGFGTNFATLLLSSPATNDSGNYSVIFSNYYGVAVTSAVQVVTVLEPSPPIVSVQPVSGSRYVSSPTFAFGVTAIGTPPFTYQWKQIIGGVTNLLTDETNQTLVFTGIQTNQTGTYLVTISNSLGSTNSLPATFAVLLPRPGTYAGVVVSNVPYAYWPLNETNGTVFHDLFNGHDGVTLDPTNMYLGMAGAPSAGFSSPHYSTFIPNNGAYARVNLPALPGFSNTMTFCSWIYLPSAPTENGFIFNRADSGYGGAFGLKFISYIPNPTTTNYNQLGYQWDNYSWGSGLYVPLTNWTFVALVLNGTQATMFMGTNSSPLTVANAGLPSATDSNFPGGNYSNTNALLLGRTGYPWAETDPHNAWANANIYLSDVAVFYNALSASNIYNLYISSVGELITTTNSTGNLVLSWPQGTLQAAGQVDGIYTNVPNAVSPHTVPTTGAQKFYRVKQ